MDGRGVDGSLRGTSGKGLGSNMANETNYEVIAPETGMPIKAWIKGVQLEDQARKQLLNVAQLPFIFKWIAAMPDVHWGVGATVGSVIPTKGAIIPAAVGVDIGCGMMAVQTDLKASDLPDNLKNIRTAIEKAVPHGRTNHGGAGDAGAWHDIPGANRETWEGLQPRYNAILQKHGAAAAAEELLDRLIEDEPQRAPEIITARARMSAGVKTILVTTGGAASEIKASASISESRRAESISRFIYFAASGCRFQSL